MKKLSLFLLSFLVLFSSFSAVPFSYAAGTDIIITNHNGFNSRFNEREQKDFDLTFSLQNRSGGELKDIYVQIKENDSFQPKSQGSKIFLVGTLEKDGSFSTNPISLRYTGGTTDKIPIEISYKKGADMVPQSTTEYIGVNITPYKEPVKEEKPDYSDFVPVLTVSSSSRAEIEAGNSGRVNFTVANNSSYTAENVSIRATVDGDSPLNIENANGTQTISRIRGNREGSFELKISADPTAKEKSYPIKLNYRFENEYGKTFTSEEIVYVKVINSGTTAKLIVDSINMPTKEMNPGETINAGFFIKNTGTLEAKDVNVSVEGLSNSGLSLVNMTNRKYQGSLAGNKLMYVEYALKASDKIEAGTYHLDLSIQYKDVAGAQQEDKQEFFINVKGKDAKPSNLYIDNLVTPSHDLPVGQSFKIKFDLKNNGTGDAKNVKVSLEMDKEIIPKSASIIKLPKISSNEVKTVEFTLTSTGDATTRNYPISINVEYEDEGNKSEKQFLNQYVGAYIEKDGEGNSSTPKIIIDQYSFNPNIVRAGENFYLNVSFLNTNKSKAVQNIKIFLTVDEETEKSGSVFTPVNSSNTFYIDYIPPKGRVDKTIEMYTVPDAKPKTYTIKANFEYEDADGKQYPATELIGIPVIQQSRLEVPDMNLPTEGFVGQPIPISLEFYNMGKVTLSNLMVKLEGNFQAENGNYFVGNFEPGNSEYFEAMIIPTEPGMLEGNLVFSYEDSNGEEIEVLKNLTMNIIEMPMEEFPPEGFEPMDPNMNEKGGFKKALPWIIGVTVVAAGAFVVIRKKMIQKKGMSLDE